MLNGQRFVTACLQRLAGQSSREDEILVVDNGSSDRTVALARAEPGVEVLEAPGLTIAGLRNLGASKARHEVLAFLDIDCLVCPGWRSTAERVLADPNVAAVGAYYDVPEDAPWLERAWWSFRPTHEHRTPFLISGNLVVRRAAFERVGGFDANLVTDEDTDLSRRLVAAGAVLVEAPDMRVIHLGNAKTLRQFYRKEKWHATSILDTMRRHRVDRPMLMTFLFLAGIALALVLLIPPLWRWWTPYVVLAALGLAPVATAAYRVLSHGNYRYFAALVPLYLIVYLARSAVLLEQVRRRLHSAG